VNLALSLLAAAERQPSAEALPGITYAELRERAARLAGGLRLEPGERLATVLDNGVETALLYWAAQWCGAVFVPLSWRASQDDLEYCIENCGARVVIRDDTPLPDGPDHPGVLDLDDDAPSLMLYTSGTTGRPKGVPRSHRADLAAGVLQALQHGYRFGDRTLGVMPLYHTMGIHSLIAMHVLGGCFVSQPRWDAEEALRLIQDERITSLFLAPTLFYDLVHHPRLPDYDLSSVELLGYAGAAMTSALVERCIEVFRPRMFFNHYGTTGRPKGVPRSHRADLAAGVLQSLQHGYRFGDRTLGVMPLYHTMGIHSLLAMHVLGGCFVSQPRWDAEEALRLIQDERITSLFLAPTLFYDLVHHPRLPDYDLSSVELLGYAGAAMTSALVERCVEVFRPRMFFNHYGTTEIYAFTYQRDQAAKPGCAGRPAVGVRLRLAESGEIVCHMSSPEAFSGYWQRPDADAKAIRDGWYHTGDVGRLDEDGDLWILGRVDDMIVSGGENVHPLEVEDVLARHPKVAEVAVVGVTDERLGHRVVAVVVAEGELTPDELDAFCLGSTTLARFKRPREYRFVESLPKSPSGKILRRLLREEVPAK
jgi:acyl-CoA synthetase (AMP-forming)/AMP-acid ligase II